MSWINLSALWKIVVYGLLAGAGLPALFAIGLRTLSWPSGARVQTPDLDLFLGQTEPAWYSPPLLARVRSKTTVPTLIPESVD